MKYQFIDDDWKPTVKDRPRFFVWEETKRDSR